jgi:23S rRNA (cytosine1962-C5)-methyltransferase
MNQDASFYLDTRNLRSWAKANTAGKTVLNTFAYTGSLGVAARLGGARQVINIDRNQRFLALARKSYALNGFPTQPTDFISEDFFTVASRLRRSGASFDCVILDPPFFSSTAKGQVNLLSQSTRLINKVRPLVSDGGWLVAVNNALFLSGADYLQSLQALCRDGYIAIERLLPVPPDVIGYPSTIHRLPPVDPAPFNHPTKIAILRVRKKPGKE